MEPVVSTYNVEPDRPAYFRAYASDGRLLSEAAFDPRFLSLWSLGPWGYVHFNPSSPTELRVSSPPDVRIEQIGEPVPCAVIATPSGGS
jgi:hypothetical protein